jgi:integrase
MKPTFRPVVYAHHKRQDGTYNVKINVYFNGKERRLPTTIYCTKNDLTRTCHIKNQDILNKCNTLIARMHNAVADISIFDLEGRDVDWLVQRIKGKLQAATFRLDFFAFAQEFISKKNPATRNTYVSALNAFALFLGRDSVDINDITKKMLVDFAEYYESQPKRKVAKIKREQVVTDTPKKKGLTTARYMSKLATIFKAAKRKYNDNDNDVVLIPRSPFDNVVVETAFNEGQKPLPKDIIQLLISEPADKENTYRYAIDAIIVSFALMGINTADLYEARPPKDGVLHYRRCKTRDRRPDGAEMQVAIPAELQPYLDRLGAGTDAEWWLPNLRSLAYDRKRISAHINYHITNWCKAHDVERFTTYAIRKAWATLARSTGADKSLVDECIGHTGGYVLTDIYALKPYDKMAELNRKVLDMFQW